MRIEHDNEQIETVKVEFFDSYKTYRKYKGIYYMNGTADEVIYALQNAIDDHSRIRIWIGDPETGLVWNEECAVMGYVGTTTGSIRSPILVYKKSSYGGSLISTNHVLRIDDTFYKTTLYQAKNFHTTKFYVREKPKDDSMYNEDYAFQLYELIEGKVSVHAQGKTQEKMEKLRDFLTGKRYSK